MQSWVGARGSADLGRLRLLVVAVAMAIIFVVASQLLDIRYDLNIWDEGFLWYGVQRVWAGEVPIRDFMAYDPGRYYWVAGIASLWGGRGILDIRAAVAVFQCMGLVAALWVMASSYVRPRAIMLVMGATTLTAWMFPRYKLFDIAISLLLVALVRWWIVRPTIRRHFCTGLAVGVIACFGRNHGVYAVAGSVLCLAYLGIEQRTLPTWQAIGAYVGGVITGFLPIVFACLFVPGFATAFWTSILFLLELKATNLPLPIPWPWTVPYAFLSLEECVRWALIGCGFIGLLVYPLATGVHIIRRAWQGRPCDPAIVASVCLAVPYAHYAFSRSDLEHLALGFFPALLGVFLLLLRTHPLIQWVGGIIVTTCSVFVSLTSHPAVVCMRSGSCEPVTVSGELLILSPAVRFDLSLIRDLTERYAPNGRAFLATPLWPGAYALMDRRSPVWEIYALTARGQVFQQKEIERLEAAKPGFVVVFDLALDNKEEMRYRNTHPIIQEYIDTHFVPVASPNPAYHIYRAPTTGVRQADSGNTQ